MENNCDYTCGTFTHGYIPYESKRWDYIGFATKKSKAKQLKKLIRQYRRKPQKKVELCHMLINLRTWSGAEYINKSTADILKRKNLHREYGIRDMIKIKFGSACFVARFENFYYGNKTVFENGKWVAGHTHGPLPF